MIHINPFYVWKIAFVGRVNSVKKNNKLNLFETEMIAKRGKCNFFFLTPINESIFQQIFKIFFHLFQISYYLFNTFWYVSRIPKKKKKKIIDNDSRILLTLSFRRNSFPQVFSVFRLRNQKLQHDKI